MNKIKLTKFWVGPKDPNRTVYQTDKVISLLDPKGFMSFLKKYSWRLVSLSTFSRGGSISSSIRLYHNFGLYLLKMCKHHGELHTVKYLKACQLAVQKHIAGQPLSSLRELEPDLPLPRLSKSGLPVIIGSRQRALIARGNTHLIRLWLTLFSIYRVIKAPVNIKINTIEDAFSGNVEFLAMLKVWMEKNTCALLPNLPKRGSKDSPLSAARLLPLEKASASNKISWHGVLTDAVALILSPLYPWVVQYCEATNSHRFLYQLKEIGNKFSHLEPPFLNGLPRKMSAGGKFGKTYNQLLGQLSFKEEAAGKLRVFAIVDVWTQSLLRPLHDYIFKILGFLPNDGTFNQELSFERCQQKAKEAGVAYGYDLSSATDRLPIDLQTSILTALLGSEVSDAWKHLLVDREYVARENDYVWSRSYKYAVGQPMGALSSWGMLALTHHLIVQYCYRVTQPPQIHRLGWNPLIWFDGYEILGDDIQIFDTQVAAEYVKVCNLLGVTINLSKSVVSTNPSKITVEYAKRTSFNGIDVSAISWKMIASQDNLLGRISVAFKLITKFPNANPLSIMALAVAKDRWKSVSAGYLAFPIISYYSNLFKDNLVSWRWLLARLINGKTESIHFASGQVPKVSIQDFYTLFMWRRDKGDGELEYGPLHISLDSPIWKTWVSKLEGNSEAFMARRLHRKLMIMTSEFFVNDRIRAFEHCIFPLNEEGLLNVEQAVAMNDLDSNEEVLALESDPVSIAQFEFVKKALTAELITDKYYDQLLPLTQYDIQLMKLDDMFKLMDQLESLHRSLDFPLRNGSPKKTAITSNIIVLRNVETISRLPLKILQEWERGFEHP